MLHFSLNQAMELDAFLDQVGGLNKEPNTPKGFLKLFAKEVSLKSNRPLSILLEAVLNTKSKVTLHHLFMRPHSPHSDIKGLHVLVSMLWKVQANHLMTAILRKGLRVLQHLMKNGVLEGRSHLVCTHHFCLPMMCKLLYDLTNHGDHEVRVLASTFQGFRFQVPRQPHFTHVKICEESRKKAQRKKVQDEEGLEDGEIPVDEE